MSSLDSFLTKTSLVDCTGRVTHTLTLRLDGNVEIVAAHGAVTLVDPRRRICLTPGHHVDPTLFDMAQALQP